MFSVDSVWESLRLKHWLTFFGLGVIFLGMSSLLGLLFGIGCGCVIVLSGGVMMSLVICVMCIVGVESRHHLFL